MPLQARARALPRWLPIAIALAVILAGAVLEVAWGQTQPGVETLSPDERAIMERNPERWRRMSPEERQRAVERYRQWRALPPEERRASPTAEPPAAPTAARMTIPTEAAAWPGFVAELKLAPMAAQLAAQTELKSIDGNVLTLALPATHKHLADKVYADKLKLALDQATGRKWMLAFEVGSPAEASLAAQKSRAQAAEKSRVEAAFRDEPFVQDVLSRFDAKIRPDSIKPLG